MPGPTSSASVWCSNEMVAGQAPFVGDTAGEVIAAVLTHEPVPLSAREAPAELARIVAKALAKEREQRYQSAKDLLIELKGLKLELVVADKIKQPGQPGQPGQTGARQDRPPLRLKPGSVSRWSQMRSTPCCFPIRLQGQVLRPGWNQ